MTALKPVGVRCAVGACLRHDNVRCAIRRARNACDLLPRANDDRMLRITEHFVRILHPAVHALDEIGTLTASRPGADGVGGSAGPDPLEQVVANLERAGAEAIVVDITTDEARQVGMHVIKALIPEAMPLSFSHHARYLATPRLYQAPRAMGLTVHDEEGINPVRQPFA